MRINLKAESHIHPGRLTKSRGVIYFNHNIREIMENFGIEEVNERLIFKYDYVVIDGNVTKQKIKTALESPNPIKFLSYPEYPLEADDLLTNEDFDRIENEYESEKP